MDTEFFWFLQKLYPCQLFKEGNQVTIKAFRLILPQLFSNPYSLGLEWTFCTFSVLKMIVLAYLMGT